MTIVNKTHKTIDVMKQLSVNRILSDNRKRYNMLRRVDKANLKSINMKERQDALEIINGINKVLEIGRRNNLRRARSVSRSGRAGKSFDGVIAENSNNLSFLNEKMQSATLNHSGDSTQICKVICLTWLR